MNQTRREFLQASAAVGATSALGARTWAQETKRPNLVYIFTDQQSGTMMSCTGNSYLKTPAMDYLAANGTRFERAYCANPVCVPSRIGMMTGRFPGEFGARENGSGMRTKKVTEEDRTRTIGALLTSAGYDLAYGGKVHLPKPLTPEAQGFTTLARNERGEMAKACADYVRKPHAKPFCLVASFINPHDICYMAIKGTADTVRKMTSDRNNAVRVLAGAMQKPQDVTDGEFFAKHCPPLPPNYEPQAGEPEAIRWLLNSRGFRKRARDIYTDTDWRWHRWAYHRLTERVDTQIQEILDALRESGQEENTVVIFSSDHGDMDASHRMEHKTALYEEAARIPLIVMHKGNAPAGQVDETHLVSNGLDLLPTLCDYAGVSPPAGLRGRSVRALVEGRGGQAWRRTLGVESQIGRMVVRDDGLKYIRYDQGKDEEQILDLRRDPHETRHFTDEPSHAKALAELRKSYDDWFPAG